MSAARAGWMACIVLVAALSCDDRSGSADDCRGPGRYEAGKEGRYRPCCAGLTEVFYQKAATDGAGAPVCDSPPLRVYACVKGFCGDGICEVGEAPRCGCVADCPSAIWGAQDGGVAADGGGGN